VSQRRFNPSVGILLVWTRQTSLKRIAGEQFQSLGRDSVGLDYNPLIVCVSRKSVSIPRSGFCWFGLAFAEQVIPPEAQFQSLGRDSVGLDPLPCR